MRICCVLPNQEDQADEALCIWIGMASCSQALVMKGEFNHLDICWRDDTAGHKHSRRFLKCVDINFLLQVIEEPMRRTAMLELFPTSKKRLWGM